MLFQILQTIKSSFDLPEVLIFPILAFILTLFITYKVWRYVEPGLAFGLAIIGFFVGMCVSFLAEDAMRIWIRRITVLAVYSCLGGFIVVLIRLIRRKIEAHKRYKADELRRAQNARLASQALEHAKRSVGVLAREIIPNLTDKVFIRGGKTRRQIEIFSDHISVNDYNFYKFKNLITSDMVRDLALLLYNHMYYGGSGDFYKYYVYCEKIDDYARIQHTFAKRDFRGEGAEAIWKNDVMASFVAAYDTVKPKQQPQTQKQTVPNTQTRTPIIRTASTTFSVRADNIGTDFTGLLIHIKYWKYLLYNGEWQANFAVEKHIKGEVFRFVRQSDGTYKITSVLDSKVLDVNGGNAENGTALCFWDDIGALNQRWRIEEQTWNVDDCGKALIIGSVCAPNSVLDYDMSVGMFHLWERHGGEQQQFVIYRVSVNDHDKINARKTLSTQKTIDDEGRELLDWMLGITKNDSVQKVVGRNDPCPCGSGKKYKNCCRRVPKNFLEG